MEAAVASLEGACSKANSSISEMERKIRAAHPDAAPLLDLCDRLRAAKSRLLTENTNIAKLAEAQDSLKQNLAQFLVPASESITSACTARHLPPPRIAFGSPISPDRKSNLSLEDTIQPHKVPDPVPPPPKAVVKKKSQSKTQILPVFEFRQITSEEYATLDPRTMGHVSMAEVQDTYKNIWNWFTSSDVEKGSVLSRRQISQTLPKARALPTALRFLKSLRRIDLTRDGDVKLAEQ
jgi:hypothetical protein